jgi:hypothetical protein
MPGVLRLSEYLACPKPRPPVWMADEPELSILFQSWVRSRASRAERFNIQNVADYFFHGTDQEEWRVDRDFPCLAPPFPAFWMEYTVPRLIVSEKHGRRERVGGPDHARGFLCTAMRAEEAAPRTVEEVKRRAAEMMQMSGYTEGILAARLADMTRRGVDLSDPIAALRKEGAYEAECFQLQAEAMRRDPEAYVGVVPPGLEGGWLLNVSCVSFESGKLPTAPLYHWMIQVAKDGSPVGRELFNISTSRNPVRREAQQRWLAGANLGVDSPIVFPVLMAITFLNCKNVVAEEVAPDAEAERRWVARHKKPSFRYKVLRIEPMTEAIRRARAGTEPGTSPLHICRGHFKDYRERGLFGRFRGVYWWDNHFRGKAENGVVVKDYEVGRPPAGMEPSRN